MDAVEEAEVDLYERAVEQYQEIAFADVEVTAAVKLRALERLIDRHEEKERQRSGQMTMAGVERAMLDIASVLLEPRFAEARMAVIEAYEAARNEVEQGHQLGDGASKTFQAEAPIA